MHKRKSSHVVVTSQFYVQFVVAIVPQEDELISVSRFAAPRSLFAVPGLRLGPVLGTQRM
jgi:hypothetical protein